jgi:hypothetical protein
MTRATRLDRVATFSRNRQHADAIHGGLMDPTQDVSVVRFLFGWLGQLVFRRRDWNQSDRIQGPRRRIYDA